jgi:hypothetical protein
MADEAAGQPREKTFQLALCAADTEALQRAGPRVLVTCCVGADRWPAAQGVLETREPAVLEQGLQRMARRVAETTAMPGEVSVTLHCVPERDSLDAAVAWSRRIAALLQQRVDYDRASAWISTLGGAYSALGSSGPTAIVTVKQAARKAEELAVEQMRLAVAQGNRGMVARCLLHVALSAMQQGTF